MYKHFLAIAQSGVASCGSTGLALILALIAMAAIAADQPKSDTPADYAYVLPLQVSGKQGVVGLRLPLSVYQRAQMAGLEDLRIFDAHGSLQPFALYQPQASIAAQRARLKAAIFPVKAAGTPKVSTAGFELDIRTRADGSVMSVHTRSGGVDNSGAKLSSLILDFGATMDTSKASTNNATQIDALRFSPPANQQNYSAEVWLESSRDLKVWNTVGATELRWLSNDSAQTLASDRLEFSPQTFRYARLSWRRGEPLQFANIEADTTTRQAAEPPRETLWIQPVQARLPGDLAYPAGIAIPVEQISLRFAEANIVYPLAFGLYSERPSRYSGSPTEWVFVPRSNATFYQISQNEQTRKSGAVWIGGGHAPEWIIHPLSAGASAQPELGISWQPATLVFLAGGVAPYTLNFGRSDIRSAAQSLSQVAPNFSTQELAQLEQAQFGALQTRAVALGADSDAAKAGLSARNRSFILWAVLLLGVVVLGGMAWRLTKQINTPPRGKDE